MSTIVTSNVSDGSLSIPTTYVTNGSAKAWVNFNGTGTIAARDSLNVSSLTDIGTGAYTVNFSNAFAAADYAVAGGVGRSNVEGTAVFDPADITSTSSCKYQSRSNTDNTVVDRTYPTAVWFGELA